MSNLNTVAKFPFVVNKSFGAKNHPITIPSRFYQGLKDNGVTDLVSVKINFRDELTIDGKIRAGLRAGGRYYQITMLKSAASESIAVSIGSTLSIRVLKDQEHWLVEIS